MSEQKDEKDHRAGFRKILGEFRKSLREEFTDTSSMGRHPSASAHAARKPQSTHVSKQHKEENTKSLYIRDKPRHAVSVLLDPRVTNHGTLLLNTGKQPETTSKEILGNSGNQVAKPSVGSHKTNCDNSEPRLRKENGENHGSSTETLAAPPLSSGSDQVKRNIAPQARDTQDLPREILDSQYNNTGVPRHSPAGKTNVGTEHRDLAPSRTVSHRQKTLKRNATLQTVPRDTNERDISQDPPPPHQNFDKLASAGSAQTGSAETGSAQTGSVCKERDRARESQCVSEAAKVAQPSSTVAVLHDYHSQRVAGSSPEYNGTSVIPHPHQKLQTHSHPSMKASHPSVKASHPSQSLGESEGYNAELQPHVLTHADKRGLQNPGTELPRKCPEEALLCTDHILANSHVQKSVLDMSEHSHIKAASPTEATALNVQEKSASAFISSPDQKQTFRLSETHVDNTEDDLHKSKDIYDQLLDKQLHDIQTHRGPDLQQTQHMAETNSIEGDITDNVNKINSIEGDITDNVNKINSIEGDITDNVNKINSIAEDGGDNVNKINSIAEDGADNVNKINSIAEDGADNVNKINSIAEDGADNVNKINSIAEDGAENVNKINSIAEDGADNVNKINSIAEDGADNVNKINSIAEDGADNVNKINSIAEDGAENVNKINSIAEDGADNVMNLDNSIARKEAQAQARAEQKKKGDVQMQFGSDGLHIKTDNTDDNSFPSQFTSPQQQQLLPLPHQQQFLPPPHQQQFLPSPHQQQLLPLPHQQQFLPSPHQQQFLPLPHQQQLLPLPHQQQFLPSPHQQQFLPPPHQQEFLPLPRQQQPVPLPHHAAPHYGSQYDAGVSNPYTSSLPALAGHPVLLQHYPQGEQTATGNHSNSALVYDNNTSLVPYSMHESHVTPGDSTQPDHMRRRREGRDHTNYVLPPHLDLSSDTNVRLEVGNDASLAGDGPPGLPLSGSGGTPGEDTGLRLVVLDESDDDKDDNLGPAAYLGRREGSMLEQRYSSNENSDVFPIDRKAIDRDMYKQVYDPSVDTVKPNRSRSVQTINGLPPPSSAFIVTDNHNMDNSFHRQTGLSPKPGFAAHLTDFDIQDLSPRGTTSLGHEQDTVPKNSTFDDHRSISPSLQDQLSNRHEGSATAAVRDHATHNQQLYSLPLADYERYTSNSSQMSSVPEGANFLDTERSDIPRRPSGLLTDSDNGTFLTHSGNHTNKHPADLNVSTGYKFQVNKYSLAKRASILNRAERLLDARRGQYTDRSDSSEELERIDEHDDEDEDRIDDLEGPRHRALEHVQRRVYDDSSTSYNSSDDVLSTVRYQSRGPVSKAARLARLTSVNARLNKQKRIRAARRQVIALAPPPSDGDNTSDTDLTDTHMTDRPPALDARYEESKFIDHGNDNQQHPDREASPGARGRRVMFFRNGDIHFKPRQVLISHRTYNNLEKLLVDLSSMVETSTGVKHVFSWPEGREIKSITEFENGKYYVCSSTSRLQRVDYGSSKESPWKGGKIDRNENFLFQQGGSVQSPLRRPRVLTIISNVHPDSREKLILNTSSQMNFEDILRDISNMINIPNPPVKALYTERKPHQKVESYSQLIRDFADHENFIACGEEMIPLELHPRRPTKTHDGVLTGDRSIRKNQTRTRRKKVNSAMVDINGKRREFFPPTQQDVVDDLGSQPEQKLKLDWVYGYRGRDVKQNLAVLAVSGELVYFVASVAVVYNKKLLTQKHYLGHSEEITCLAVHPNGRFVATGQISGQTPGTAAHVRVWDGRSLSTVAVVGLGSFQDGVACVSFSDSGSRDPGGSEDSSGDLLMAVDESDRHVLSVWEWQSEKLLARTTTTREPVVCGCFYAFDHDLLVTFGKEHIHFWRIFWEQGKKVMRDKLSGNFQGQVPKFVTSVCFAPNGDVITGDSSGAILVWSRDNNNVFGVNGNVSAHTRTAHKKSVSTLCMLGDGTLFSGGGNVIKAWDSVNNYSLVKERTLPQNAGHVRTIVPINTGGLDGSIYVGTTKNKVLEGSLQLKFKFIIQGHVEELWALESHPVEETFVSAGHDQMVIKWSAISHTPVWKVNIESPCTSMAIDPKGHLITLGTTSGKVLVLNSQNGSHLTTLVTGIVQINALSFSPDSKQLAVGTYDGLIQIFHVQAEGVNFFRPQTSALKCSNSFVMTVDWSLDSKLIQVVMGDYEIAYWNITNMQKIRTSRNLRNVQWATHNCPVGHLLVGPWQNLDRDDVINVVSRSLSSDLLVAGDTKGRLRLFRWPCSGQKTGYRQTKVYSSNVTCATFTCNDHYVITSGGNDAALMQFSVLDPVNRR